MEKTKWFRYTTLPEREGLYECSCGQRHYFKKGTWWNWWSNTAWVILEPSRELNKYYWRGLTEEQKCG